MGQTPDTRLPMPLPARPPLGGGRSSYQPPRPKQPGVRRPHEPSSLRLKSLPPPPPATAAALSVPPARGPLSPCRPSPSPLLSLEQEAAATEPPAPPPPVHNPLEPLRLPRPYPKVADDIKAAASAKASRLGRTTMTGPDRDLSPPWSVCVWCVQARATAALLKLMDPSTQADFIQWAKRRRPHLSHAVRGPPPACPCTGGWSGGWVGG